MSGFFDQHYIQWLKKRSRDSFTSSLKEVEHSFLPHKCENVRWTQWQTFNDRIEKLQFASIKNKIIYFSHAYRFVYLSVNISVSRTILRICSLNVDVQLNMSLVLLFKGVIFLVWIPSFLLKTSHCHFWFHKNGKYIFPILPSITTKIPGHWI